MLLGAFLQDNLETLGELAALEHKAVTEWAERESSRTALNMSPLQGSFVSRSTAVKQYGFPELVANPG